MCLQGSCVMNVEHFTNADLVIVNVQRVDATATWLVKIASTQQIATHICIVT